MSISTRKLFHNRSVAPVENAVTTGKNAHPTAAATGKNAHPTAAVGWAFALTAAVGWAFLPDRGFRGFQTASKYP